MHRSGLVQNLSHFLHCVPVLSCVVEKLWRPATFHVARSVLCGQSKQGRTLLTAHSGEGMCVGRGTDLQGSYQSLRGKTQNVLLGTLVVYMVYMLHEGLVSGVDGWMTNGNTL